MNKPFNQLLSTLKDNFIKSILLTLLLILAFSFLLVSCTKPPEPIRMLDINSISNINYTIASSQDSLTVNSSPKNLAKTNANSIENFMLLRNIIESYESQVFELATSKKDFSNNLELENDDFDIKLEVQTGDSSQQSYELLLDMKNKTGIFSGSKYAIELNEEIVTDLLLSNLIDVQVNYSDLPETNLTYNNMQVNLNSQGSWNYFVYDSRYQQNDIKNRSQDKPIIVDSEIKAPPLLTFNSSIPSQVLINTYDKTSTGSLLSSETLKPTSKQINFLLPEINGHYYTEIICDWDKALNMGYGTITYSFTSTIEVPETYTFSKTSYQPGDLIVVQCDHIDSDLNYTIESNLYNQGLSLKKNGDSYYIFLPIMSKAELGSYTLSITDNDYPDSKTVLNFDIVYKEFDVQHLETSGSTASLQSNDNYDQLNEAFARGRANLKEEKLWDGKFIQPIGGRISTEYGQIRYTNGSDTATRHSGIDFANPTGTVILATQNGYVTLAEELNITGNTLFIDHGLGIVSQYYHTNKIYVKVGDYVEAGEPVAEVGTTGFSTGPHLHFAIYNNGIYLNPWKFFEEAPF